MNLKMLQRLELTVPPPLVMLATGALMWALARISPALTLPDPLRTAGVIGLTVLSAAVALAGVFAFQRARTTIHPLQPDRTTALVQSGIYRFSRHPMYLGLLGLLMAWSLWLTAPLALLGPLLFVAWIQRFQIIPEERALAARFGVEFETYRRRVRTWI